jgi:ribosomal protein S18 acetylase RimI-like enzyme
MVRGLMGQDGGHGEDEMTVTIRRAVPAEYDEIGALTAGAYLADGFIPAGSGYESLLRDAADRAAKAELWVATGAGGLLGSVTFCGPGSVYREIAHDDEGEFRMLAVSPAARGTGVGTALTLHCLDRSRELGFRRVVMCSASTMETAHRIYRRLGFTRLPERDWEPVPTARLLAFTLDL